MTVNKYLGIEEAEFFTVEELKNALDELIAAGKGGYIVMMPAVSSGNYGWADNIFISKTDSFTASDEDGKAVYLEALSPEEDERIGQAIFG